MFFVNMVAALALGVAAFLINESRSSALSRAMVWLSLVNLIGVAGINLLYAMETWWN